MLSKVCKIIILVLMILNGLMFISNIYVFGDREAAIEMHDDLAPSSSELVAITKVVVVFIVGILNLVTAIAILRKKYSFALAGFIGFLIFDGLYLIQIIIWAEEHPRIWIDFSIFGTLSLIFGIFSLWHWKKRNLK